MDKLPVLLAGLLLMALPLPSQFQEPLSWARQFGTANQDDADGVFTDARDTYVVGFVTVAVEGRSRREAYLAKYGERGKRIWYRQYGAMLDLYAKAVTGDTTGIYVAGYGMGKAYLRKFSLEGVELANTPIDFGGSANVAWGIARDSTGVYVTGYSQYGFGGGGTPGDTHCFLIKFAHDAATELWRQTWNSTAADYAYGVAAAGDGVAVVGTTFGRFGGTGYLSYANAFVAYFSRSGTQAWLRQFGPTTQYAAAWAVAGAARGIYVGGDTGGTLTGTPNAGGADGFVRRYNLEGDVVWTRAIRTQRDDSVRGVAMLEGQVAAAGSTGGVLPGQDSFGQADAYLRIYDRDGTRDETFQFGSKGYDTVRALSAESGRFAIAGQVFGGALPTQRDLGSGDAFVIRGEY